MVKSHLYHLNPVIVLDPGPTDWREEWWVRGAGRAPLRLLGSCAGSPGARLAYFSHLLDVVQEEKPREKPRTRRWPEEEAPSIGGSDGRDTTRGFFRHPLGWHPLGRASAGGPEMPDGRPLRGGSGSNAVRGRFFVSVKPCQGLCRRGSLLGPSTVPSPAPWRRRRREVALGCDTFAGPEGAGGVL